MSTPHPAAFPAEKAFSYLGYRFFFITVMCTSFAVQIMSVSVGWQIYDLTGNPLLLGMIGLAQFLPALLLVLVTGLVADRFSRRKIMAICLGVEFVCALSLFFLAEVHVGQVWPIFVVLVCLGLARAFLSPASDSLAPNLVPPPALANAIAMTSTAWQLSAIVGPVAGGLLYGVAGWLPYVVAAALVLVSVTCVLFIPKPPQRDAGQATNLQTMLGGFRYIWGERSCSAPFRSISLPCCWAGPRR